MPDRIINNDPKKLERPKNLGPKRRWWVLVIWFVLLTAVLVVKKMTAFSFETGYWTEGGFTDPTQAELLWYRLPAAAIILLAIVFFIGSRWWVPEKETRFLIRCWGFLFTFIFIIISFIMSWWYSFAYYYMD